MTVADSCADFVAGYVYASDEQERKSILDGFFTEVHDDKRCSRDAIATPGYRLASGIFATLLQQPDDTFLVFQLLVVATAVIRAEAGPPWDYTCYLFEADRPPPPAMNDVVKQFLMNAPYDRDCPPCVALE